MFFNSVSSYELLCVSSILLWLVAHNTYLQHWYMAKLRIERLVKMQVSKY